MSSAEDPTTWLRAEHANLAAAHDVASTRGWNDLASSLRTWAFNRDLPSLKRPARVCES